LAAQRGLYFLDSLSSERQFSPFSFCLPQRRKSAKNFSFSKTLRLCGKKAEKDFNQKGKKA
jgi:hypothetical protein